MKKIYLLIQIIIVFIILNCEATLSKPTKINLNADLSNSWSNYQGIMHWDDAKAICESQNMRLPSFEEMGIAANNGLFQKWKTDLKQDSNDFYWMFEESENESVFIVSLDGGITDTLKKSSLGYHFRCIKDLTKLPIQKEIIPTSKNWTDYLGRLSWEDANKKCANLKMTLPTQYELTEIFESGAGKGWLKNGAIYWTSQEIEPLGKFKRVNDFNIYNGRVGVFYNMSTNLNNVRCIKKSN